MKQTILSEWELARYLINAKKNVDTILFIEKNYQNFFEFPNDAMKKAINEFCNSTCNVLDNIGMNKPQMCADEPLINLVYTERDKNVSHKDENYEQINFDSTLMKNILRKVKNVARVRLPKKLTLNFLCWDSTLFRWVKGVTKDKESEILKKKVEQFRGYNVSGFSIKFDNEDIVKEQVRIMNQIEKPLKSRAGDEVVTLTNGLTNEEGIQLRQDSAIALNLAFGTHVWPVPNPTPQLEFKKMREQGYIDEYGILRAKEDVTVFPLANLELKNKKTENQSKERPGA